MIEKCRRSMIAEPSDLTAEETLAHTSDISMAQVTEEKASFEKSRSEGAEQRGYASASRLAIVAVQEGSSSASIKHFDRPLMILCLQKSLPDETTLRPRRC